MTFLIDNRAILCTNEQHYRKTNIEFDNKLSRRPLNTINPTSMNEICRLVRCSIHVAHHLLIDFDISVTVSASDCYSLSSQKIVKALPDRSAITWPMQIPVRINGNKPRTWKSLQNLIHIRIGLWPSKINWTKLLIVLNPCMLWWPLLVLL
jgi:hypothetical protein